MPVPVVRATRSSGRSTTSYASRRATRRWSGTDDPSRDEIQGQSFGSRTRSGSGGLQPNSPSVAFIGSAAVVLPPQPQPYGPLLLPQLLRNHKRDLGLLSLRQIRDFGGVR